MRGKRGHPLKGKSQDKNPLLLKKDHIKIFLSLPPLRLCSLIYLASVISFIFGYEKVLIELFRTSHPSGHMIP